MWQHAKSSAGKLKPTRSPSHLRLATRKCVHLVNGHVTKMAVTPFDPPYPKTPRYTQTSWLYVLQNWSYGQSKFYIVEIGIFYLFVPVTLTTTQWPSYTYLTHTPWRYTGYANMNFLCQAFRKLSSDRQTQPKLSTTPLCGWSTWCSTLLATLYQCSSLYA